MKDNVLKEDRMQVYEIGYLLVSSIPEEKVTSEVAILKEILSKKGAEFIAEEAPELRTLAYTMAKKIGATHHRFDQGYFGWFKFELSTKETESVKKAFEENPHMLRMLFITTVKEGTYLGKKSPSASLSKVEEAVVEQTVNTVETTVEAVAEVPAIPVSVEEIDKSIDEMVKEA
jgi:ribosomal protein S6